MEQEYNEYYIEKVLIKGYVHDEENYPVENAIIILEKIYCENENNTGENQEQTKYLTHTLTNCYGEFSFFIEDKSSYYRIKVFDNHHS
ncbi:MAG: hypothetical protein ACERKZ_05355 [Lachnotalea sp.]